MLEPDRRAPGRSPCSFVGLNDAHAAARPDYFERRKRKHRAGFEDASRWQKHLAPYFEHLRPARVDAARIRAFIEAKLAQEANPATVRIYIALLSALFADLRERGIAQLNPSRGLPRSTMRLMRSTHDPRTTPFIEKLTDVRRIYLALPEPRSVETEDERRGPRHPAAALRQREWSEPPCKPGPVSPPRRRCGGGGHSSRTRVAAGLERAYPGARRATVAARSGAPLFALAPGGACRAAAVAGGAVRSCRTVSPLPAFSAGG